VKKKKLPSRSSTHVKTYAILASKTPIISSINPIRFKTQPIYVNLPSLLKSLNSEKNLAAIKLFKIKPIMNIIYQNVSKITKLHIKRNFRGFRPKYNSNENLFGLLTRTKQPFIIKSFINLLNKFVKKNYFESYPIKFCFKKTFFSFFKPNELKRLLVTQKKKIFFV
jgi:hypothetical protein